MTHLAPKRFAPTRFIAPAALTAAMAIGIASVASVASAQSLHEIAPTGEVEKVHGDFGFTEGPAWDPKGHLYFTDIPNATIFRVSGDDELSKFNEDSNFANGLVVAADGRMLVCEMGGQVTAYDLTSGDKMVLAAEYEGKRFNAPNDLIPDTDGGVYFTDPFFRAPEPLPQGVQAVYYIDASGKVSRVTEDLPAPNGVGLSPDGKRLYVIPSRQAEMLVYDIVGPGKIENRRDFCRLAQPDGETATGGDGMAVDVEGNVYLTSALGIQIFSADGKPRGIVAFPEQPANVTFGDEDRKTMYVTARTGLYRVRMPIAGNSTRHRG